MNISPEVGEPARGTPRSGRIASTGSTDDGRTVGRAGKIWCNGAVDDDKAAWIKSHNDATQQGIGEPQPCQISTDTHCARFDVELGHQVTRSHAMVTYKLSDAA